MEKEHAKINILWIPTMYRTWMEIKPGEDFFLLMSKSFADKTFPLNQLVLNAQNHFMMHQSYLKFSSQIQVTL